MNYYNILIHQVDAGWLLQQDEEKLKQIYVQLFGNN